MNILKTIFSTIFLLFEILFFWVIICALIAFISVFFNTSIDFSEQIVFAILFILFGIFGITTIRKIFKDTNVLKIFYITFGYIAPICSILLGLSLIINLSKLS